MVSSAVRNVNKRSLIAGNSTGPPKESERGISPTCIKWHHEAGSLASLREKLSTKKISDTATTLIAKSKSKGTRANYGSAWGQFASWCSDKQVDPISCPLDHVLDYLGFLYDKGFKYGTINNHRSTISAYHIPIDGVKVGSHPLVCDLLKGVNNERPPLPKYRFIWDVELVLGKMNDLPGNHDLSMKTLGYKLVTLLGLCAVQRGSEIHALNIKWMSKTSEGYKCYFGSRLKHSKQGKVSPPVEFYPFPQNPKLCPVL